jgi:hypothetical protein
MTRRNAFALLSLPSLGSVASAGKHPASVALGFSFASLTISATFKCPASFSKFEKAGPFAIGGDDVGLVVGQLSALRRRLEEEKEGELFGVIALGEAVVAQVAPDFADEG